MQRMKIIDKVAKVKQQLYICRRSGKTVGFVPTMGALHQGHAALVKQSVAENDITIVSIFVNPTQFNDAADLLHYPRTPENDYALLESLCVDFIFTPAVEEVYPESDRRKFEFGLLDKVMEGRYRPGHFNGVAQVVSKLFSYIEPDKAYFGEKDYQQLVIIKEMVRQLQMSVEIVQLPTVREEGGLAMSSRNQRLTEEQRGRASRIYSILRDSTSMIDKLSPSQLVEYVKGEINKEDYLLVEYFEIVDGETLQPLLSWDDSENFVGCAAVFCADVRLIDNIRYK